MGVHAFDAFCKSNFNFQGDAVHAEEINPEWPNALRWFLAHELHRFSPWRFIDKLGKTDSVEKAFSREDLMHREVFVFAFRQDCDDFAGLEVVAGKVTDRVIYFHPSFGTNVPGWNIVEGTFVDVFEFVAQQVIPDMRDWASTTDASEVKQQDN